MYGNGFHSPSGHVQYTIVAMLYYYIIMAEELLVEEL